MATTRDQARLIAHNQRIAKARQAIFAAIEGGQLPMEMVMDESLPLTPQERQNTWNQMAANQWIARRNASNVSASPTPMPEEDSIAPFSGTQNQLQQSLNILQRSPEWQSMDEKSRAKFLQAKYGTEIAGRYISSIKDREAVENQRRKTFDDAYETERTIGREKRQAAARLADTEPEMLSRRLLSGDWVVRGNGMFERNPAFNSNNPLNTEPALIPLSSSGEATVARHWDQVMPGRPNPLNPETLARIQVAEENPDFDAESIVKMAGARIAAMNAAKANPAGALSEMDEIAARRRIAARQAAIPSTSVGYDVERSVPMRAVPSPVVPTAGAVPMRFGQKVRTMFENAGTDLARIPAVLDSRLTNVGQGLSRAWNTTLPQIYNDVMGIEGTLRDDAPYVPQATTGSIYYPDWLK